MVNKKLLGLVFGLIAFLILLIVINLNVTSESSGEDGAEISARGARISWMNETINQSWQNSSHANTFHGGITNNTYCAKCMSPFQADLSAENSSVADPIDEVNWTAINCTVCHDPVTQELALFNGSAREAPVANTSDLCGACHDSSHHTEYPDWLSSAHANTFHGGSNNNTYCAHCMSPFQFDPAANYSVNDPISEENWTSIGCIVCHEQHSLELGVYDGTQFNPVEDISRDLCGSCHTGSHHTETADWNSSKHADTFMQGVNNNTYCAHCMSPYQAGPEDEWDRDTPVLEDDWDSIGCIVCHDKHSLELKFFNGSEYNEVDDISRDLCGACHQGSHHPETADWNASAHASTTYEAGNNDNTYCAHCMSPFQSDPNANHSVNDPVAPEDWEGIGCIVCHDKHSLELVIFNGSEYEEVEDISRDLCGACHTGSHHTETADWNSSAHASTYIQDRNNNTYCAHCMSPYQAGPEEEWDRDTPVLEEDWESIGCIVCHDKHSLELVIFNGSEYNEVEDISRDLCGHCHTGHHTETDDWNGSAHANSYHGYNDNTYCAHCMSPYQGDPDATSDVNDPVGEDNWTSIGCIVCHDKHSLELVFYNGEEYEEVEDISRDLCGACHQGERHTETEEWNSSAHANTYMPGRNNNTYCAHCMSPFQAGPEEEWNRSTEVLEEDWESIGCIVCHDKHSLELVIFNGEEYEEVEDISRDLCGNCHSGHHTETEDWNTSAHANTYHGYNGNTYCAHCMSPFQYEEMYNATNATTHSDNNPISEENWTGITCIVCHSPHSLELAFYNGTGREEPVSNPADLCGKCHEGDRHPQYPDWSGSAHALSFHGGTDHDNANDYCAKCMSPFQFNEDSNHSVNNPVAEDDWWGITCTVCHDQHSLELGLFNGTERAEPPANISDLCGGCHGGSERHHIYDDWKETAHANTYASFKDNTYCAHCMSPYQAGDEESQAARTPVGEENWTSIGCTVCHEQHSLELGLYNGSAFNEMTDSNDLCGSCHTMGEVELGDEPHHPQIEMRIGTGAIDVDDSTYMSSVECSECHMLDHSHSLEPEIYACVVCHEPLGITPTTNESAELMVNNTQNETATMLQDVHDKLEMAEVIKRDMEKNGTWNDTLNDTYWRAVFNYHFVDADASLGAHNPDYAKALLELADDDFQEIIDAVNVTPKITVTPTDGSVDVPVTTVITVTFEMDIDFTDFETNDLLTVTGGVTGTLSYDNSTFMVTFTPDNDLDTETEYTVTLSKDVMYADNTSVLIEDFVWSFTTAAPTEIELIVGPIKDEEGVAVSGATVTVTIDGKDFSGTTDENGFATITVPLEDFAAGAYNISVTKADYDDIAFEGTFDETGGFTEPTEGIPPLEVEEVPPEKKDKDEDDYTMFIIAVIIVIIIIILLIALLKRPRPEEEEEAEEEEEEGEEEEEEEVESECPECGAMVPGGEGECPECGAEIELEEEEEAEEEEELEEGEEEAEEDLEEEEPFEEGEEEEAEEDEFEEGEEEEAEEDEFEEGEEEEAEEEELEEGEEEEAEELEEEEPMEEELPEEEEPMEEELPEEEGVEEEEPVSDEVSEEDKPEGE
jgi:hypothetical protein